MFGGKVAERNKSKGLCVIHVLCNSYGFFYVLHLER